MFVKYLLSIFLGLIGALALVLPSGYSIGFYFLCFASLVLWLRSGGGLLPADTRLFALPLLFFSAGQVALAFIEKYDVSLFGDYLPFYLLPFGLWGIRKYKPTLEWFWGGLVLGAIGAAIFSGYQAFILNSRASGYSHAIQFGNIALLMGVLCFARALTQPSFSWLNISLWIGFVAGLVSSVLSQTRGGWVALIFVFVWIYTVTTKKWQPYKRRLMALFFCLVLIGPALQPNNIVYSRVTSAVNEFSDFLKLGKQDTAVGARLAMWTLALENIWEKPLIGHGHKGWIDLRNEAVDDGRLSNFSADFSHVHNEYLDVTFKHGLLGLALYLGLYLLPMLMFFKPYLSHEDDEVRALAIAGMVIPMMYLDFGITQTFLSHNSGRVVLCGFWMCVAGLLLNAVETSTGSIKSSQSR